jgi:hypothetical protein
LQEYETSQKARAYTQKESTDPYKAKDYSVNIKTPAVGFAPSRKVVQKHDAFSEDTLKKYKTTTNKAYEPSYPDQSTINKYGGKSKNTHINDSKPIERRKNQKSNKQDLNDSWEQAWDDDNKVKVDEFTTYQKPMQTEFSAPKRSNLLDDDNFNFNEMKNKLPQNQIINEDDSSGDEGNKDFEYDFFKESDNNYGAASTNNAPLNLNARVNQKQNNIIAEDEDDDFFSNAGNVYNNPAPQKPTQQPPKSFDIDDVFSQPQSHASQSPDFFNNPNPQYPPQNAQPMTNPQTDFFSPPSQLQSDFFTSQPQVQAQSLSPNIFASDPSSLFQNPSQPQSYNTMAGGYYGYGQPTGK